MQGTIIETILTSSMSTLSHFSQMCFPLLLGDAVGESGVLVSDDTLLTDMERPCCTIGIEAAIVGLPTSFALSFGFMVSVFVFGSV